MRTATPLRVGGGWRDNRVRSRLGLRLLATTAPERAEQAAVVAAVRSKPACALGHFGTTSARRASAATTARWATARTVSVADGSPGRSWTTSVSRARSAQLRRCQACSSSPRVSTRTWCKLSRAGRWSGPGSDTACRCSAGNAAPGPTRPRQPGRAPRAPGGRVSGRARARTAPGPRGTGARRQDSGAPPCCNTSVQPPPGLQTPGLGRGPHAHGLGPVLPT